MAGYEKTRNEGPGVRELSLRSYASDARSPLFASQEEIGAGVAAVDERRSHSWRVLSGVEDVSLRWEVLSYGDDDRMQMRDYVIARRDRGSPRGLTMANLEMEARWFSRAGFVLRDGDFEDDTFEDDNTPMRTRISASERSKCEGGKVYGTSRNELFILREITDVSKNPSIHKTFMKRWEYCSFL